ncbi:hypothetical protein ACH3XW_47950 [Acanthocheilonema viteae]|uniref:DUF19 domain-containing protein n=1 Tax=Acanthocheilonema viteae TaxID=6277 RepID=A0A498SMX0_ACAVI|nr:unnamed protein product [Acanthocheilonema viteae]
MSRTKFMAIILMIFIADRLATGLMRRCKCEEDNECQEEALNSVDKCSSDCGYNLAPIGGNIQDMVDCFGKQEAAIQAEDVCLRRKINYKCDNRSQSAFVSEINFDNLEFTFNETTKPAVGPLLQKIYDSLDAIFKCGHDLTDHKTLMNFVKDCFGAYSLFYIEQMQACHCLLHKLHLTKLAGACIHVGNPLLKGFK